MISRIKSERVNLSNYRQAAKAARAEGWGQVPRAKLMMLYLPWRRTMGPAATPLTLGLPWLSIPAISFLKAYLKPHMKVCEFGCGGSTIFFARRVREVVSIEHDQEWYAQVQKLLADQALHNVQMLLRAPETAAPFEPPELAFEPNSYRSTSPPYSTHIFYRYASAIDLFPDAHFDLVLVDGRARPSCLKHNAV